MELAGWRHFTTADFACLPDAFQQLVERFFFHSPYYTPLAQYVNGKIGFIENQEDAGIKVSSHDSSWHGVGSRI